MLWKYKNPGFDVTRPLCVEFVGEAGGVMREFFHLLMERLKMQGVSINLFEGQVGHLVPINNYDVLSGSSFVQAGKMILHSILNDCHDGVPGLSPAVVSYLISGRRDAAVAHVCVGHPRSCFSRTLNKGLFSLTRNSICYCIKRQNVKK